MNLVNLGKAWPLRLLVLLLLLSAQSFSLAHELTHAPDGDNGVLCEICAAGHSLDATVPVAHATPNSQCATILRVTESPAGHYHADTSPYIARAPPLNDVI